MRLATNTEILLDAILKELQKLNDYNAVKDTKEVIEQLGEIREQVVETKFKKKK